MDVGPIHFPDDHDVDNEEALERLLTELGHNCHYDDHMIMPRVTSSSPALLPPPSIGPIDVAKPDKDAVEKTDQAQKVARLQLDLATAETRMKILQRALDRRDLNQQYWERMAQSGRDLYLNYYSSPTHYIERVTEMAVEHHDHSSMTDRRSLAMMRFSIVYTTVMSLAAVALLACGLWPAAVVSSMTTLMGFFMIRREANKDG